jgi:hypothetical protein
MTLGNELELGLVPELEDEDPAPEDGELGYTSALEGGLSGLELSAEDPYVAPGQVTLEELLEDARSPNGQ